MLRYLFSRFTIILLIDFFWGWLNHSQYQIVDFFHIEEFSNFYYITYYTIYAIIILIFLASFNGLFCLLRITEQKGLKHTVSILRINNITVFINNWVNIFNKNFNHEQIKERFSGLFIVLSIFFLSLIDNNFLINRFTGICIQSEVHNSNFRSNPSDEPDYELKPVAIFSNKNQRIVKDMIDFSKKQLIENGESNNDEIVTKKYFFLEAGLIDGFLFIGENRMTESGLIFYLKCLIFYFIEKLIIVFIYFLIPFSLAIKLFILRENKINNLFD